MQLLRNTPCLRLLQMTDIGCTLILTALAVLTLCIAVNDYQMVPYETTELVKISPNDTHQWSSGMVEAALHGSVSMSVICTVFSFVAAIAAASERRVFLLIVSVLSAMISVVCISIGIVSFVTKGISVDMLNDMFKKSVNEYTNFTSPIRGYMIQRFVDRVQYEGHCCGFESYVDYVNVFQSFTTQNGEYVVCINETAGLNYQELGAQQIPFSCCPTYKVMNDKEQIIVNLRCAGRKFEWSTPYCTSAWHNITTHNAEGCEKKLPEHSERFSLLGVLVTVAGVFTCIISAISVILAMNVVTSKEEVVAALCKEFDLTKAQIEELERAVDAGKDDLSSQVQVGLASDRGMSDRSELSRLREGASKMAKTNQSKSGASRYASTKIK